MEAAVVALLEAVGEDITREGLRETPRVHTRAWASYDLRTQLACPSYLLLASAWTETILSCVESGQSLEGLTSRVPPES